MLIVSLLLVCQGIRHGWLIYMASVLSSSDEGFVGGTAVVCFCDGKLTKIPNRDFYFRTCEDGAGWHLIPYIISPRSEFFSQAYKNWHIMWGINLGPDWPPLARGSKFHTIHTPTRPLSFLPLDNVRIWTYRF